jgi:hypothetical protein
MYVNVSVVCECVVVGGWEGGWVGGWVGGWIHTCIHTYMHAYIHTYIHAYIGIGSTNGRADGGLRATCYLQVHG